jgi:hypothetical protein
MLRLGIVPHGPEIVRLVVWVAVTFVYVALWLAFGLLLSVVVRRADRRSSVSAFGCSTVFGQPSRRRALIRRAGAGADAILGTLQLQQFVALRERSTRGRYHPQPSVTRVSTLTTIGQVVRAAQIASSLDQSPPARLRSSHCGI